MCTGKKGKARPIKTIMYMELHRSRKKNKKKHVQKDIHT